jgi:hypothetical protein
MRLNVAHNIIENLVSLLCHAEKRVYKTLGYATILIAGILLTLQTARSGLFITSSSFSIGKGVLF